MEKREDGEGGRDGDVPRLTFLSLWKDTWPTAMSPVFCMSNANQVSKQQYYLEMQAVPTSLV